MAENT